MNRVRGLAVGELWAAKVKPQAVGTGHQVHQGLEASVAGGPRDRGEAVVEPAHSNCAIDEPARFVTDGALDNQNLLVDLLLVSSCFSRLGSRSVRGWAALRVPGRS